MDQTECSEEHRKGGRRRRGGINVDCSSRVLTRGIAPDFLGLLPPGILFLFQALSSRVIMREAAGDGQSLCNNEVRRGKLSLRGHGPVAIRTGAESRALLWRAGPPGSPVHPDSVQRPRNGVVAAGYLVA
jgi:hypothetical protein